MGRPPSVTRPHAYPLQNQVETHLPNYIALGIAEENISPY